MRPRLPLPPAASLVLTGVLLAGAAGAGAQAIGRGFDLERSGRFADARAAYLGALDRDPTNVAALLGLERVLPRLGRTRDLLPLAERAAAIDTTSEALRALLVRTYVTLDLRDEARAAVRRWVRAEPKDETPYREWAVALADVGAYDAARAAYLAGRQALGKPAAFAPELAEVAARMGDWEGAAAEWGTAVAAEPEQLANAAAQLGDAPADRREVVLHRLTAGDGAVPERRLAAELALGWDDPARGWTLFVSSLGAPTADDARALYRFADLAGGLGTTAGWRVRGLALSRVAGMVPEQLAVRAHAEAARAFLAAGDDRAAHAELARVAGDARAPLDAQRLAQATLVRALIEAGRLDSAAAELHRAGAVLDADTVAALHYRLARAHLRRGDLGRAVAALGDDSSVTAAALRGRVALYQGDLADARRLLQTAGPYAGDRDDATERSALLALIEAVRTDSEPALGAALFTLARGDSAAAVPALAAAGRRLRSPSGRGEVLLLAGRIAARPGAGDPDAAEALFEEVVRSGGAAAAPAAELEWARLLVRQGQSVAARTHLEHLILTYPGSAVVPTARRELERINGAIPRS
jgi:tetratricopeptide (TPR) repeat protein